MADAETQSESRSDSIQPKVNSWAMRSLYYGLLAIGFLILSFFAGLLIEQPKSLLVMFSLFSSFVLSIIAFVCGIWGLIGTYLNKGTLKGTGRTVDGLLLSLPCILLVLGTCIIGTRQSHRLTPEEECRHNLNTLQKAIMLYSKDNGGKYPAADKWCDMLMEHTDVTREQFQCPWRYDETGLCSYAINPNANPNSPPDTVLLFETEGGWNQFGGPELMNFDNHHEGCNVLFNDGHVEFITTEEKDRLRWKDHIDSVRKK